MCADTVQKRTARVRLPFSVKPVGIAITLIAMLLLTYQGHRSWCLLSRPVASLDAVREVRKDRDKPLGFSPCGS